MNETSTEQASRLQQLVELRLGGSLESFVVARLAEKGWRAVAVDVERATGVTVSHQTLRNWFASRVEVSTTVRVKPTADAA